MDEFSGSLDNLGRRAPRRKKRLARTITLIAASVLVVAGVLVLSLSKHVEPKGKPQAPTDERILAAWSEKDYNGVLALCETGLDSKPLEPLYLVMKGFASFYRGIAETDGEIRLGYMDASIFSLRKALTEAAPPFKAQVLYVLGKAYYHKGRFYLDESVRFLESAEMTGYSAEDTLEYIAVAYSSLGNYEKSVAAFEKALARRKTDLLLLAAARAYVNNGNPQKAEITALEALSITEDSLVREKSRFLLGELYSARKDFRQAEEQYKLILDMDPDSADAHYYLGLIWQEKGDPVRARAEWRRAVSLDPMHTAARQKLAERI